MFYILYFFADVLSQLDAHHPDGVRAVRAAGGAQRQDHISDTQGREAHGENGEWPTANG